MSDAVTKYAALTESVRIRVMAQCEQIGQPLSKEQVTLISCALSSAYQGGQIAALQSCLAAQEQP